MRELSLIIPQLPKFITTAFVGGVLGGQVNTVESLSSMVAQKRISPGITVRHEDRNRMDIFRQETYFLREVSLHFQDVTWSYCFYLAIGTDLPDVYDLPTFSCHVQRYERVRLTQMNGSPLPY